MKISEFISKLKLAHDVPNYYNNKFPYNCGYYDGKRYSFDCWCMIKAIIGNWTDCRTKGYYVSPKNFPTGDCNGYQLLMQCSQRSKDFSMLNKAGAYLYISDKGHEHAGIYIGDFTYQGELFNVVECTSDWAGKVQYTYVDAKGQRFLYKGGSQKRSWTDWGILPYIEYDAEPTPAPAPVGLKTTFGIDISNYQRGLSLLNAKGQGVQFSVLKAGGADGGSSSPYYKDKSFETFYSDAMAYGVPVGAYYFGHAFSVEDAKKEASCFINYLSGKQILHVWYDVEGQMLNQGYTHLTDIIRTFCETMVQAGYVCGIYTSASHFNRFNDASLLVYPHWVACYGTTKPTLKSGALIEMWQFGGSVNYIRDPHIAGYVCDQDYCYFDIWQTVPEEKHNMLTPIPQNAEKTVDQLAIEVLAGLHGNGIARKLSLGSRYTEVQKRVEEIIAERKQSGKTHVVARGENLSQIAKRYNTTVDKLVKANNIANKNLITVGQELKIV